MHQDPPNKHSAIDGPSPAPKAHRHLAADAGHARLLPVIVLAGSPNVGKSTLFNRLTRSRAALVANQPGLTRDRLYAQAQWGEYGPYVIVDTGGLAPAPLGITVQVEAQTLTAVQEADVIVLVTDARAGLTPADQDIALRLRRYGKPIIVAANKSEGLLESTAAEFHNLGLGTPWPVSAEHGQGIAALMDAVFALLPPPSAEAVVEDDSERIKIAVVGRPNAGKSTFINRLLGAERVLTYDEPGTTRDSVYIPFTRDGTHYTLIDTAGVRRKSRVQDGLEKFSVIKALQAMADAHVVVLMLDATQGIAEHDAHLLGLIVDSGRALVLAINKWDGLSATQRAEVKRELDLKLAFIAYAKVHTISALHGTGVGEVMRSARAAWRSAMIKLPTPKLNDILAGALQAHQPPQVSRRRIKPRYAHQGGHNPPLIIIHGNQVDKLPVAYQRYLVNTFRAAFKLTGTPLRVEFKPSENPYQGRVNLLNPRQQAQRRRLMRHVKS